MMDAQGASMAVRSTRRIQSWRWACLAALALLAGCQSKSASSPGPAESMGAPAAPEAAIEAAQPAEPETALPADEPETAGKADRVGDERAAAVRPAPPPAGAPPPPPERPRSPAGDTGQGRTQHPGYAGAVPSQQRRRPSTPAVEADGREIVTRREGTAPDGPEQTHEAHEAHGTKNTEEPPPEAPPPEAPRPQSVEEFYASLPEQAIAFHVPRSVQRGEMFAVRLVVQPGQSEAALERALVAIVTDAGPAPAPGDVRTRTTRIGDEMQASISSPTLQIVPRGEDRQLVRRDAVTEWAWDVTANAGGSHRLTLSLYAIPPGRSSGIKVKTFEETLTVEVTFFDGVRDTVADNWEWMWTFVLGPIGALAWRRRQRRHAQAA
jgi:hypothetical protein